MRITERQKKHIAEIIRLTKSNPESFKVSWIDEASNKIAKYLSKPKKK